MVGHIKKTLAVYAPTYTWSIRCWWTGETFIIELQVFGPETWDAFPASSALSTNPKNAMGKSKVGHMRVEIHLSVA